jgi:protein TonB
MNFRVILTFWFFILVFFTSAAQSETSVDTSALKIFEKVDIEASFPGGEVAWRKFLEQNLRADVPLKRGAPAGSYTVWIQFVVDKNGNVSDLKPLTNLGYGMEAEIVRVLKKSPKWIPANQNGSTVRAYRKQPVTFVIEEVGRKRRN